MAGRGMTGAVPVTPIVPEPRLVAHLAGVAVVEELWLKIL